MTNYDKPFKTIEEQIELLKSRNLIIHNDEVARSILITTSYYTLINGYKNVIMDGKNHFIDGVTIEQLQTIYFVDFEVSSLILRNILYIERLLKSLIAYRIAEQYGVYADISKDAVGHFNMYLSNDYLSERYYSNNNNRRRNILRKIKKSIDKCKTTTTTYYYKTKKNHIPPWVVVNDISFGTAIEWFRIMKRADKEYILSKILLNCSYQVSVDVCTESLLLLRDYRNRIAHGNRPFIAMLPKTDFLTFRSINSLLGNGAATYTEYSCGIGKNDTYAALIAISILLVNKQVVDSFQDDIEMIADGYSSFKVAGKEALEVIEIPTNIKMRMQKIMNGLQPYKDWQ